MAPSTPQGLLVGSKREHPFHLLGIHTQQSFNQLTLYPLVNLVPFTGNTITSPLLWRASLYPQFAFQFPTGHTQSHKSSNTQKASQSSFMAGIYRQWSCLQLCQVCQSASSSVLTLFWDFSLSQQGDSGGQILPLHGTQVSSIVFNVPKMFKYKIESLG